MRLRRDAQAVVHRVMHRPRGKQVLDFRVLVQCTMPSPHWKQHVLCAVGPCSAAGHVGASPAIFSTARCEWQLTCPEPSGRENAELVMASLKEGASRIERSP